MVELDSKNDARPNPCVAWVRGLLEKLGIYMNYGKKQNKIIARFTAALMTFVLMLGIVPTVNVLATGGTASRVMTVASVANAPYPYLRINGQGQYTDRATFQASLQAALNAPVGNSFEITGFLENDSGTLAITIPAGNWIDWNATYICSSPGRIIALWGDGTFMLESGGNLISTNTDNNDPTHGILAFGSVNVGVNGGRVENNSQSSAIFISSPTAFLTIFDGIVRSNAEGIPAIVTNGRLIILNGLVEASGAGANVITLWTTAMFTMDGGRINGLINPQNTVLARDDSAVLLTDSGAMALAASGGRINRLGNDSTAYFIGSHAARFNGFTLGTDLFRLDEITLSQTNTATSVPQATATFTTNFAFNNITVVGVPALGGSYVVNNATRSVAFSGNFHSSNVAIIVNDAVLANGRLNAPPFTTQPFAINVEEEDTTRPYYANDFFYIINHARETIAFGDRFTYPRLDPTHVVTRNRRDDGTFYFDLPPLLLVNDSPVLVNNVPRSEITFIFNRRADRIRVDRGRWGMTLTGESDISRHIRRGGFIGVRRRLAPNRYELIAIVPLDARPHNREIRAHRANIFVPSRMINGDIQHGGFVHNPTSGDSAETLEIRIGNDRVIFGRPTLTATERIAPGAVFALHHDIVPRGTRGTFRIAPTDIDRFVPHEGRIRSVRDLLRQGVTTLADGTVLELGEGNFGSAPVRFRIPNQPNAPAVDRMTLAEGRNGAPQFISRTNQHMYVNTGNDTYGNPIWRPLAQNITLPYFIAAFQGRDLPPIITIGGYTYREFEIRFFRENRVASAPGRLRLPADSFAP